MSRSTEEWIGKNDDTAIPPRVKIRVFEKHNGYCQDCELQIRGKLLPAYDHIIALINGGQNRESNITLLCVPCHAVKTRADVAEKSVTARKRAKAIGVKKPRTITRWRRFDGSIREAGRTRC